MAKSNELDAFDDLRLKSSDQQISAGSIIVRRLVFEQGSSDKPSRELQLALKRLVRGMSAPRGASRVGFFTVFSAIPKVFQDPIYTFSDCIQLIENELQAYVRDGETDVLKGTVLAYGSLIFSGKIFEAKHDEVQLIIKKITDIRVLKSYLRLAVYFIIIELVKKLDVRTFKKRIWDVIRDNVIKPDMSNKTLEFYYLLMVISRTHPAILDEKSLNDVIGAPAIIHPNTVSEICLLMISSCSYSRSLKIIESTMFNDFLECIISDKDYLKVFWTAVVNYVGLSSITKKVKFCLKMFTHVVRKLDNKNWIRFLLKEPVIAILESAYDVPILEKRRVDTLKVFADVIKDEGVLSNHTIRVIMEKLVFSPGDYGFAFSSGEQIINALVKNFDKDNVKYFGDKFYGVVSSTTGKLTKRYCYSKPMAKPWKIGQKKLAYFMLTRLLTHPALTSSVEWKMNILPSIIDYGFFFIQPQQNLQSAAKKCFFSVLDHKEISVNEQKDFYNKIILYVNEKLLTQNYTNIDRTEEFIEAWNIVVDTVGIIEQRQEDEFSSLNRSVFELMFLLIGILILKDAETSIPLIKELHEMYYAVKSVHKDSANGENHNRKKLREAEDKHWVEVIVDMILAILSKESRLHRVVVSKIFVHLCPILSSSNIFQLLRVLNPEEKSVLIAANGDGGLEESEGSSSSDGDDDDSSVSDKMDVSDEEVDPEEQLDEKNLEVMRAYVFDAMRSSNTETDSICLDEMSEEEGEKLDERLSAVFKNFKQFQKKTRAIEEQQTSAFRSRVIELLELFLKTKPEVNAVINIMVALLMLLERLIDTETNFDLQNKIRSFLKKLAKEQDVSVESELEENCDLEALLRKMIYKNERTVAVYSSLKEPIVDCCTFILKWAVRKNCKPTQRVIKDVLIETCCTFFTTRNTVIPIGLYQTALSLPWNGAIYLGKAVSDIAVQSDLKPHQKEKMLLLLNSFFSNGRWFTDKRKKKYKQLLDSLVTQLIDNISVNLSPHLRKSALKLFQNIKRLNLGCKQFDSMPFETLRLLKKPCAVNPPSKSGDSTDETASTAENKEYCQEKKSPKLNGLKSKKRKHKDALHEKKLIKLRRAQEASSGLEEGAFVFSDFRSNAPQVKSFLAGNLALSDEEED